MRSRALFLVLLGCSLFSASSYAQSDQDRATARLLAVEGDRKMAVKDYQGAMDSFTKANALVPAPTLKLAIARAKIQLGQLIESQQLLLEASRSAPQPGEPATWPIARVEASKEASAILPRLPLLEITVEGPSTEHPTHLFIDKQLVSQATIGIPRAVNPGPHVVHAEAEGFQPADRSVSLKEGEHQKLSIQLESSPNAAGTSFAASSTTNKQDSPSEGETKGPNALLLTGGSLFVVGAGVGAVTGYLALHKTNDIKNRDQCSNNQCMIYDPNFDSDKKAASALGIVSTVGFGVAGAGAVLAVVGLIKGNGSQHKETHAERAVHMLIGPSSIGMEGRF